MGSFKKYEILEHPSDVGLKVYAGTIGGLFEICAEGMFSIICRLEKVEKSETRSVSLFENNEMRLDEFMILWLDKLLYLHEVESMLFSSFRVLKLEVGNGISGLDAEVNGEKINLLKHELHISIKAPTYHMLQVKKDCSTGLWTGQVIFDV
ncbi:MAG: archease [Actinobacteria bacterium]|nr:archease [Actinomycetota bacterium]